MTHFEEEIKALKQEVSNMFGLVNTQIEKAYTALQNLDKDLAHEILNTERRVNALELKIDLDCENYLALYSPVAIDLRYILAVLKINSNLERTGDIAEGIARFVIESELGFTNELISFTKTEKMFDVSLKMINDVEEAFNCEDAVLARSIFKQDIILDEINMNANRVISEFIRNNDNSLEQALHILSTIRKLERVGDHAKNIAEEIIFYLEAKVIKHHMKT